MASAVCWRFTCCWATWRRSRCCLIGHRMPSRMAARRLIFSLCSAGLVITQSLQRAGGQAVPFLVARFARIFPVFLRGVRGGDRGGALVLRLRADAVDRSGRCCPNHLCQKLAGRLAAGNSCASNDDPRAVPQRGLAWCLAEFPWGRVEPFDRVAILSAGAAGCRPEPRDCAGFCSVWPSLGRRGG